MDEQILTILKMVSPKGVKNSLIYFFCHFFKINMDDLMHIFGDIGPVCGGVTNTAVIQVYYHMFLITICNVLSSKNGRNKIKK
jgi:hypothetical protein